LPKSLLARFLLAYAASLLLVALIPQFLHLKAYESAFSEWQRDPNEYTGAELRHQQQRIDLIKFGTAAIIALPIAAIGVRIHSLSTSHKPN
jgi:hypothetical protein